MNEREKIIQFQKENGLKPDGINGPKTKAMHDQLVMKQLAAHPEAQSFVAQNDPTSIFNAIQTGDWSGVRDSNGQPFSNKDQQQALNTAQATYEPYFREQQAHDQYQTESNLQQKQAEYQSNRQNLDQTAANQGVLFSGGRIQKQQQLQDSYARGIGDVAENYQYKYGDTGANNLSQYYNLPGQSSVAGKGGLSSVYNTSGRNYYGRQNAENLGQTQMRAAQLLQNKTSKLVGNLKPL